MIRQAIADKIKTVDSEAFSVGIFFLIIMAPILVAGLGYLIYAIVCLIVTGEKP